VFVFRNEPETAHLISFQYRACIGRELFEPRCLGDFAEPVRSELDARCSKGLEFIAARGG
jgi:hypothetical protein